MAAQAGNGVVLSYGAQGSQQLGTAVVLDYSAATGQRRVSASTAAAWRSAALVRDALRAVTPVSVEVIKRKLSPWRGAATLRTEESPSWILSTALTQRTAAQWLAPGALQHARDALPWGVATALVRISRAPWLGPMRPVQPGEAARWGKSVVVDQASAAPWLGPMRALLPGVDVVYARSAPADRTQDVAWNRYTTQLAPSYSVVIPVYDPSQGLEALYVVPVQKVYMAVNTATLRRVDTDTQLPTFALSLSLAAGSWVWSFDATLPADQLSVVEPVNGEPVELEATINGTPFRVLADSITRDREFGKQTIRVAGRGKASMLDIPYSQVYTFGETNDRTAQQLMNEALGMSEFGATWTLNWGATDWLVPAGVWNYTGSQIGALNTIATAAGLYLQPDPSALTMSVLPQYPLAPWDWQANVAPDFELPADVVQRESIQWADKLVYNRVFVSGAQAGVLGQVTRTGTAGDLVAPMVTDALITAVDAARQRGIAVLSDTGRIATVTLRLPVLATTGIIQPGKFVRYDDGGTTRLGIVRSTSLEVAMPAIWQTIGVETHVS